MTHRPDSTRALGLLVCLTALAVLAPAAASADDAEELGGMIFLLEEERVTSASRFEQSVSDSPSSVTVITREEIESSGAWRVLDLLRLVPGLDVIDIGTMYSSISVRAMGDESNTTVLVLVDGVKMNVEFTGGAFLDTLSVPLEEIERIEVIRGPGSALWGQNAYLGVVNIITRDPRQSEGGLIRAAAGSLSIRQGTARYAYAQDRWGFRVFGNVDEIDGRAERDRDGRDTWRGGFTFVSGDVSSRELRFDLFHTDSEGMIFSTLGEVLAGAELSVLRTSWRQGGWSAQVYWTRLDIDLGLRFPGVIPDLFPALESFNGVGDTYDAELLYERSLEDHHLTVGAAYRLNHFESPVQAGGEADETLTGVFAQDVWRMGEDWTLTAGARFDTNSLNESAFSPRLALLYRTEEGGAFRVSAGRAFRNPAFIENQADLTALREVFPEGAISNPDLENENVTSFELAYSRTLRGQLRWEVNLFYNQIRDFVSFNTNDPSSPTFARYENLEDGFDVWGGEGIVDAALSEQLDLFGHLAYAKVSEVARDPLVDDETPEWRVLAGVRLKMEGFRGELSAQYVASRTTDIQDPNVGVLGALGGEEGFLAVEMDPYVLVNLHCAYRLWDERLELFATAINLLDSDVQDFPGLPWDSDHDPSTAPENFGGEPIPRQVVAGVSVRF